MSLRTTSASLLPERPYRGIRPFRFIDQQIFAAREDEIWDLVSNVTLYRAVLFYGDSGTGKSSLIDAGLLPQVLEENYVPDRLRVQPFVGREIRVERIALSGSNYRTYLPSNFIAPELRGNGSPEAGEVESFELSLAAFQEQLTRLSSIAKIDDADFDEDSAPRPLLIFDQFEEFVTLFEEVQRGGPTPEAKLAKEQAPTVQHAIRDVLVKLIQGKLPVTLIFSFREDYLAKLSSLLESCPELLDQSQRLLSPSIEDVPRIIRLPFENEKLRAHFLQSNGETKPAGSELTESLARRIATALGRRSEGTVNLTELQIVCLRLWQSSDPENLFRKEGITGILRNHAAEVFGSLSPELRDEGVTLLSHMITGSNTRNIISEPDLLMRASERTKLSDDELRKTLDVLCDSQLVSRERRRDLFFYELVSEYFVTWINELVSERSAVELRLKARETRRRLALQRIEMRRGLRREQLLRRALIACSILFLVVLGLGAFASYLYKRSVEQDRRLAVAQQRELDRAESFRQLNEKSLAAMTALGGSDAEKLEALKQIKKWNEEGNFPPQFVAVVVGALSETKNEQIKQTVQELSQMLAQAASSDQSLSQLIGRAAEANTNLAEKLPPRFYIHIADESQRTMAQKVANALKQQGYLVPSIHVVGGDAKWDHELRYFRKGEEGMPEAKNILELLKQATGINWQDGYNPRFADSPNVRPGHFEIWFPAPTGQLLVSFIDEEGKPLQRIRPRLTFEPVSGIGNSFIRRQSGYIAVPPGSYDVTINVTGFKELHRQLSIEVGERVDWSNLQLERESPEE